MWSDLALAPPSRSNDGSLALVSCLSGGYKFASVLFCTRSSYSSFFFSPLHFLPHHCDSNLMFKMSWNIKEL